MSKQSVKVPRQQCKILHNKAKWSKLSETNVLVVLTNWHSDWYIFMFWIMGQFSSLPFFSPLSGDHPWFFFYPGSRFNLWLWNWLYEFVNTNVNLLINALIELVLLAELHKQDQSLSLVPLQFRLRASSDWEQHKTWDKKWCRKGNNTMLNWKKVIILTS